MSDSDEILIADCIDFIRLESKPPIQGMAGTWWRYSFTVAGTTVEGQKVADTEEEVIDSIRPFIAEKLGIEDREGYIQEVQDWEKHMPDDVAVVLSDIDGEPRG